MLNPSDQPQRAAAHTIQIRDLRLRFGDLDAFAAECSCGWRGENRMPATPIAWRGEMAPNT